MKGTNKPKKHMETYLIGIDTHGNLSQSEENKCVQIHSEDGSTINLECQEHV
jgi:hypothetical protein